MVFLYKNKKPMINDVVIVKINDINNLNIVASLTDYNDLTGYISYTELCRKKRYKLNKIVTIGKEVIVQITGFNNDKNYAELSIRSIIPSDIKEFNNSHRTYLNLYNLWRYVFMKQYPELNMDIHKINNDEINNFMENTLWLLHNIFEEKDEEFNCEIIYNNLINPINNMEILKCITAYNVEQLKTILDNYSLIKIVPVKLSKYQEFTICSYEMDGLTNLKNAMDYKSFDKYLELDNKYDISILYLTGGKYSLTIKQKIPIIEDITESYDYLIQEIKTRCYATKITINI